MQTTLVVLSLILAVPFPVFCRGVWKVSDRCQDPGWFQLSDEGQRRSYLISERPMTFREADTFCTDLGGTLAVLASEDDYAALKFYLEYKGHSSVWISDEERPEYWTTRWRTLYADGEPDFSGDCLYLSASRGFLWRDTSCWREKFALCQTNKECSTSQGRICLTESGKACAFPFEYGGQIHWRCTTISDLNDRGWCSTSTDAKGVHREGSDTWGYCMEMTQFPSAC